MIIDTELVFSDAQAITVSAASTNYLNFGAKGDDYFNPLFLYVKSKAAFVGGTSVEIRLETADDSAFTTPQVLFSTGAILTASLTANKEQAKVRLPIGIKKYVRVNYIVVGTFTAGTVDAFLVADVNTK